MPLHGRIKSSAASVKAGASPAYRGPHGGAIAPTGPRVYSPFFRCTACYLPKPLCCAGQATHTRDRASQPTREGEVSWWKDGIQVDVRFRPEGFAVATLYAAACLVTRQLSLDQFYLPAGVRIAALLLVPVRLWPYLLLGEYAYFAQIRMPMATTHGLAWVILGSIGLMPLAMLIVRFHRRHVPTAGGLWLLSLSFSAGIAVSLLNMGLARLLWPGPDPEMMLERVGRTLLGQTTGILTLAPLALLWLRRHSEPGWSTRFVAFTATSITLIMVLGLAMKLTPATANTTREQLVLMASLPAIALAFLHGWRGAAIAVPLLNLIVLASTPSTGLPASFDLGAFSTQQSLCVISVALLALGSGISHYQRKYQEHEDSGRNTVKLARASYLAGEQALRSRALELKSIGDGMDMSVQGVVDWLKTHGHHDIAADLVQTSATHSWQFRQQASMIYPTAIEQIGLYLSLQASGVRDGWNSTGRMNRPQFSGDPCQLSVGLQLSAYRLLIDAVPVMLSHEPGQIHIQARCGRLGQRHGIMLNIALLDRDRPLTSATEAALIDRLGGRLIAYDGMLLCRHHRITIILSESLPSLVQGGRARSKEFA